MEMALESPGEPGTRWGRSIGGRGDPATGGAMNPGTVGGLQRRGLHFPTGLLEDAALPMPRPSRTTR